MLNTLFHWSVFVLEISYYDTYTDVCMACESGSSVNGSCMSLLDTHCDDVSDRCTSHIGYRCLYNHKCSCAPGYQYNCITKRCVYKVLALHEMVECPHIIQDHVYGKFQYEVVFSPLLLNFFIQ